MNAWMVSKLWFGSSTKLEKVRSKPNLLYMCLMTTLSDDLFNCIFLLTFFMLSKPYQRKATSTKELYLIKTFRESIPKSFNLFSIQIMLIRLFKLYLKLFKRFIFLCINFSMYFSTI